jgi:hypothetical protein
MRGISGSEERKKGERGLQIEEEESEGRIGRNDTMTGGRCDATERGEERAEQGLITITSSGMKRLPSN